MLNLGLLGVLVVIFEVIPPLVPFQGLQKSLMSAVWPLTDRCGEQLHVVFKKLSATVFLSRHVLLL